VSNVIPFPKSAIVRIVPAYQEDVRIRFAREVEHRLAMIEAMEGNLPRRCGMNKETYLGDGLYVSFDGYLITLRAPRLNGDHWVGLEPPVYQALLRYVESLKAKAEVES
jgi:hypothetical protein